jgi:predicted Zn-dependent protease
MGHSQRFLHGLKRRAASVLLPALLLLPGCAVNPVTGENQLVLMSEEQELHMGAQVYPIYTQMSEGLYQDSALQAYVQTIGGRLAAVGHRPGLDYRFNIVNASEINAYALPGGKISITRGLLTKMDNEAQLASVLGHEIGHVTARHAATGYTRQVLAGLVTTAGAAVLQSVNVQGTDLILQGGVLGANLVLQKYSRDQERQSDELGMEYMTAVGYNPDGMAQTMKILMASHEQEPSAVESLFLSHPLSSERYQTAVARAQRYAALRAPENLRPDPFRKATARLRETAAAYSKMDEGRKALARDDGAAALQVLREATDQAPQEAMIWTYRALAEVKTEQYDAAYSSATRATQQYPDYFRAQYTAGAIAFKLDRHTESLRHLNEAERLVPGQPPVAFYKGRNFETQGRREEAAAAYASVLQAVEKGPMAEYCYERLVAWGYLRPAPRTN